jgi:UrcA family protein
MATLSKWISTVALATVVSVTSLAQAAEHNARTMTVKAWDLDLTKAADVQTLYERLHAAANDVCRDESMHHWKTTRVQVRTSWRERCVSGALDTAVRDIANSSLAAVHTQTPPALY